MSTRDPGAECSSRPPSGAASSDAGNGPDAVHLNHQWRFLKRYLGKPEVVGAVAPSSSALAAALCEPYRRHARPARVLEVGAGTGPVTRHLGRLLKPTDELDICEVEPEFLDILEHEVLTSREFTPAVEAGRVKLLRMPVQEITHVDHYDFVISGLPLTAFKLRDVRDVFRVIERCLKPGGILSYFEYVGLRRLSRTLMLGEQRRRIRLVSAYLNRHIRAHQVDRQTVLPNAPPAYARHLCFTSRGSQVKTV